MLKLLQETYLGKIKIIYIDPPYNTGNDFLYDDDLVRISRPIWRDRTKLDEDGNRLTREH